MDAIRRTEGRVVGAAGAAGGSDSGDAVLGAVVIVVGGYLFGLWRDERAPRERTWRRLTLRAPELAAGAEEA